MYLATGLLPLGKTQLSEFGFSASAEHPRLGPVRCPWSLDHTAGASSAGSAALVAAGAVPIAHANDGGGSIRIPASVNGLVGLKPTRGRLAQDALMRQMPVQIVSDGVLTRSVRDTAAFFREAEHVYRDLRLPPIGDVTGPGRARLRIAVITEGIGRSASPGGRRPDAEDRGAARGPRPRGAGDREPAARVAAGRLPAVLVDAGAVDGPRRAPYVRPHLGRRPARQPHPGPGRPLRAPPPPAPRRDPTAPADDPVLTRLLRRPRRAAHADAGDRDARDRPPRADPGLRHDHGAAARLGGVHAAPERHRRPGHQPAARDHRRAACRRA